MSRILRLTTSPVRPELVNKVEIPTALACASTDSEPTVCLAMAGARFEILHIAPRKKRDQFTWDRATVFHPRRHSLSPARQSAYPLGRVFESL